MLAVRRCRRPKTAEPCPRSEPDPGVDQHQLYRPPTQHHIISVPLDPTYLGPLGLIRRPGPCCRGCTKASRTTELGCCSPASPRAEAARRSGMTPLPNGTTSMPLSTQSGQGVATRPGTRHHWTPRTSTVGDAARPVVPEDHQLEELLVVHSGGCLSNRPSTPPANRAIDVPHALAIPPTPAAVFAPADSRRRQPMRDLPPHDEVPHLLHCRRERGSKAVSRTGPTPVGCAQRGRRRSDG